MTRALNLDLMPGPYAAVLLDHAAPFTTPPARDDIFSLLVDVPGERTLICPESAAPTGALDRQLGWRVLRIVEDTEFDEPGILVSITRPISAAGIGLLGFSTYTADVVLVKQRDLGRAIAALTAAGHTVTEKEPIP